MGGVVNLLGCLLATETMVNAKSFTSGTQTPLAMSKKKKKNSALTEKRRKNLARDQAIEDFRQKQINEVWFDARSGVHLVRKGDIIVTDRGYLKGLQHPLSKLIRSTGKIRKMIDGIDAEIKSERSIQYHGPVAGQRTGDWLECGGSKWLVTASPKLTEPSAGEWPHLKKLLETLLPSKVARDVLYSWCKTQYKAISLQTHSQCPVLILAGDTADGKTLFLKLLTTLRGGREINPIKAWSGEGPAWNDHLLGCECLNIDDSVALKNYQSRQNLATKIKEAIFASAVTIDKRNNTSFTVDPRPVWGVAMAVNANSDSIKTVPALDGDDMRDKAIVLRTHRADVLYRDQGDSAANKRWKTYVDELPHFVDYLLNDWKMPEKLQSDCSCSRSGALIYRDPEAMTDLHRASPAGLFEEVLRELADSYQLKNPSSDPLTTAKILEISKEKFERDRRIPEAAQTAGKYLTQIAARPDAPIKEAGKNRNHSKLWIFQPIKPDS